MTTTNMAEARRLHAALRDFFAHYAYASPDFRALGRVLTLCETAVRVVDDAYCREKLRTAAEYAAELLSQRDHAKWGQDSASGAEFLRNIHCFNLASALSFGIPVGDVPSVVDQPRLVAAIVRNLYLEGVDTAAHERYINTPLAAPDPAPYQRSVTTTARAAA